VSSWFFHPQAQIELVSAAEYLENETPGTGSDFLLEIESSLFLISDFPEAWPLIDDEIRRFIVSRFSYSILYKSNEKRIEVIAIMHHRQEPGYWTPRLS
jgi:plasmid stabilization system protein ParE